MGTDVAAIDEEEQFDPIGTLALIAIYFAILVLMWIYTYFVEFVGGGATVIG